MYDFDRLFNKNKIQKNSIKFIHKLDKLSTINIEYYVSNKKSVSYR